MYRNISLFLLLPLMIIITCEDHRIICIILCTEVVLFLIKLNMYGFNYLITIYTRIDDRYLIN